MAAFLIIFLASYFLFVKLLFCVKESKVSFIRPKFRENKFRYPGNLVYKTVNEPLRDPSMLDACNYPLFFPVQHSNIKTLIKKFLFPSSHVKMPFHSAG